VRRKMEKGKWRLAIGREWLHGVAGQCRLQGKSPPCAPRKMGHPAPVTEVAVNKRGGLYGINPTSTNWPGLIVRSTARASGMWGRISSRSLETDRIIRTAICRPARFC